MFRKAAYILILLCMYVQLYAQQDGDKILFGNYAVQSRFRQTVMNRMSELGQDKNQTYIDSLIRWAEEKDDFPLKQGLRIIKYQFLSYEKQPYEKDFAEGLLALVNELQQNSLVYHEAEALSVLSDYCWRTNKYSPAFEYAIKAYNIYSHFTVAEFPRKTDYTAGFGGKYYHFRDFNTAKKYHLEALNDNKYSSVTQMNTLGLCYLNLGQYDSAEHIFNRAFDLALKLKDSAWIALLQGNMGYVYYSNKNYDKALPLLEREIDIFYKQNVGDYYNAANSLSLLSRIYLQKNEKEKALEFALRAYQLSMKEGKALPYEMQKNIFPQLAQAYAANGDMKAAYAFLDSAVTAKDTIAKRTNMLVLAGAQHNMDADKHMAELQKYEHDQSIHKIVRNSLVALIALVTIIAILFISRQKLKFASKQKKLEAEKVQAETELQHAESQLGAFTQNISEKNDLIEKFTAEINRIQKLVDPALAHKNEALNHLQAATILTDEQWSNFQHMVEKVHKGFLKRLKHKAQGLSPVDIRFMVLCKLRLTEKEMSGMMGISRDAVKQNLERLRHKLNLQDTDTVLEDFADTI